MLNKITHTHLFQEFKKILLSIFYYKLREYIGKRIGVLEGNGGCIDYSDPRTLQYSEIAGGSVGLENSVDKFSLLKRVSKIQDQTLEKDTKMMCVAYATSHGVDVTGFEIKKEFMDGKTLGRSMYWNELLSLTQGAYLIDGAKHAKRKGQISGYMQVNTIEEIKNSLINGSPVVVGSNKISLKDTYSRGFSVKGDSIGHCFLIVGYNAKGFEVLDSWKACQWTLLYTHLELLFNTKLSLSNDEIFSMVETYKVEIKDRKDKTALYEEKKRLFLSKNITEKQWKAFQIAYRMFYKLNNYSELLKGF